MRQDVFTRQQFAEWGRQGGRKKTPAKRKSSRKNLRRAVAAIKAGKRKKRQLTLF